MTEKEVVLQAGNQMQEEVLRSWDAERVCDEAVKEEIEKRFSFGYPYEYLGEIPVKVSVSAPKTGGPPQGGAAACQLAPAS